MGRPGCGWDWRICVRKAVGLHKVYDIILGTSQNHIFNKRWRRKCVLISSESKVNLLALTCRGFERNKSASEEYGMWASLPVEIYTTSI